MKSIAIHIVDLKKFFKVMDIKYVIINKYFILYILNVA